MEIVFSLSLPRDEATVPVVRRLCRLSLDQLGATGECVGDIELAVSEACTNVLKHAARDQEDYEVGVKIDDTQCDIQVVDPAAAFEHADLGVSMARLDAESGRGVYLMRALVDDLHFVARPNDGTALHLAKALELRDDAILQRLTTASRQAGRVSTGSDSAST